MASNPWMKAEGVNTVAEFLARYYRPDRYTGRGPEYAKCLLASHEADFLKEGYDIISHHDSVTGEVMYIGTLPDWARGARG